MPEDFIDFDMIANWAPEHDRTSCSDANPINGFGGWTGRYDPRTGEKEIRTPRCTRCYMLQNEYRNLDDLEFVIKVTTRLVHRDDLP